jgi:succinyl-CoA synthetase alpha subunit
MSIATSSTVKNLILKQGTRVMYQGFTGRQATLNAKDSIDYGTNVVGGITPGKAGTHPTLALPVFDTVRQVSQFDRVAYVEAKEELKPDATAVFVPAHLAAKAIEEAIEAEIPLIVSVAEGMPVHDALRVQISESMINSRFIKFYVPNRRLN